MKTMIYKKDFSMKTMITFLVAIAISGISTFGQSVKKHSFGELEDFADKGMEITEKIYSIVKDYPAFSYEYVMENGELKEVEVTGIENDTGRAVQTRICLTVPIEPLLIVFLASW